MNSWSGFLSDDSWVMVPKPTSAGRSPDLAQLILILKSELSVAGHELFQKMIAALQLPSQKLRVVPFRDAQSEIASSGAHSSRDIVIWVDPEALLVRPEQKREVWNELKRAIEQLT
jgi:hypothetical protein